MPPLAPHVKDVGPWIWIANPHRGAHIGGRAEVGDYNSLIDSGKVLLRAFKKKKGAIESENAGRTKGAITRRLVDAKERLKNDLASLAKETKVISGKVCLSVYISISSHWSLPY